MERGLKPHVRAHGNDDPKSLCCVGHVLRWPVATPVPQVPGAIAFFFYGVAHSSKLLSSTVGRRRGEERRLDFLEWEHLMALWLVLLLLVLR